MFSEIMRNMNITPEPIKYLRQINNCNFTRLTIMRGVFLNPHIEKSGLEPLQGYRYVSDGVENNFSIDMLDEMAMKAAQNQVTLSDVVLLKCKKKNS